MANALVTLRDFTEEEVEGLSDELAIKLQVVRYLAGVPIHITSGERAYGTGAHPLGQAVDISDNLDGEPLSSRWRHLVLKAAYAVGFRRIGTYDRHLHLDVSTSLDQDVSWWGEST